MHPGTQQEGPAAWGIPHPHQVLLDNKRGQGHNHPRDQETFWVDIATPCPPKSLRILPEWSAFTHTRAYFYHDTQCPALQRQGAQQRKLHQKTNGILLHRQLLTVRAFGTTLFPSDFTRYQLARKFRPSHGSAKQVPLVVPGAKDWRRDIAPIDEAAQSQARDGCPG